MIHIESLFKHYQIADNKIPVLHNLSFNIDAGEFVAIMGSSGSGKSTLLNIIGCLDTPGEGRYTLNGISITDTSDDELARIRNKHIGFVFQSFNLIPRINAIRNVELPMVYAQMKGINRKEKALQALGRVGLKDRAEHSPAQLSGGQQQRVAIARALINDPEIIIADEPTGSLDTSTSKEIMNLFSSLHEEGKTIIMVTHEDEIAKWAKRTIQLKDGAITSDKRSK